MGSNDLSIYTELIGVNGDEGSMGIEDILKILREHKDEFRKNFSVKRIGVFGSYARGGGDCRKRCRCLCRILR